MTEFIPLLTTYFIANGISMKIDSIKLQRLILPFVDIAPKENRVNMYKLNVDKVYELFHDSHGMEFDIEGLEYDMEVDYVD